MKRKAGPQFRAAPTGAFHRRVRSLALLSLSAALAACARLGTPVAGPSPLPTRPSEPPPSAPPAPGLDPWLAYVTDVSPGSAVQFVTSQVGWRLEGQAGAPHLDGNLAAGPMGTSFDWPGGGVSASTDGGRTWNQIFNGAASGIWGFDLLSPDVGWVVGVTSLSQTVDGGSTWRQVGEPSDHPLVTVDFVSQSVGYGLTTTGQLVHSTDGGASWSPVGLQSAGSALCFGSAQTGYVSDQSGDVLVTSDGGTTWTRRYSSPVGTADFVPFWTGLSCAGQDVWQEIQVLDPQTQGSAPYVVSFSADHGSTWSVIAANSSDASLGIPQAPSPVQDLVDVVGSALGDGFLIGFPAGGFALSIVGMDGANGPTPATVPALASGPSPPQRSNGYLTVYGASFVGTDGWILLNDNAVGSPDAPQTQTYLLTTTDGGASWSVLLAGSPQAPPSPACPGCASGS